MIENTVYNRAVIPRQDEKGLVIAYVQKDQKTLGNMTLESVFEDFSINMNGVIVVCKDDTVVSTNNEALLGKNSKELKEYYSSTCGFKPFSWQKSRTLFDYSYVPCMGVVKFIT